MRNKQAGLILFVFDLLMVFIAFTSSAVFAYYISNNILDNSQYIMNMHLFQKRSLIFIPIITFILFVFYSRGHYQRRIPWWSQVRYILIILGAGFIIEGFTYFVIKTPLSRLWFGVSWVNIFLCILIGRYLAKSVCNKLGNWQAPTILIGSGQNIVQTLFAMDSDSYAGYDVKKLIITKDAANFARRNLPAKYQLIEIIECQGSLDKFIENNFGYFYILSPDEFDDFDINSVVNTIKACDISYAMVPPLEGLPIYGLSPQYFFGHDIMFLNPRRAIASPLGKFAKRLLDITASATALIILSPLFILFAFWIKKDGGSAFYSQDRVGLGNSKFRCLKFRSMREDAETALKELLANDEKARAAWETHRKLKNDPRITKAGKILRKTSLDELPQLINVLKGDMSLVGPRPILPDEETFFTKRQYENYCSVRPGITGLWQVSGRNDTTFEQRVFLDDWYVKNWSLYNDIVILFKTVATLVKRAGAY